MCSVRRLITHEDLIGGIIASTLTPFDEAGDVMYKSITDQARRLSQIDGVIGIAVNTSLRERPTLTPEERLEVIRCTRNGLKNGQILVSCVGELSEAVFGEVIACKTAGADAIISFLPKWQKGCDGQSLRERVTRIVALTDCLALPVILDLGIGEDRWTDTPEEIALLASMGHQILGFDMRHGDNVLHYDQDYYALKTADRPMALLTSSEGALFHNLNTGVDGVLSSFAYIVPHEVAALYNASRNSRFPDAQAIHNKLVPLTTLLNGHDADTREMVFREVAHARGLLASPLGRRPIKPLCPHLTQNLHSTLDNIALEPVSWV